MPVEQVDARKTKLDENDALQLASSVNRIYSAKGNKIVELDLKKDKADKATITAALLGPSGNLRAPALRIGKTLVIGFDQDTYDELLS
jgi:arsenate reductase-like glutaredoxin family protein